MSDVVAGTLLTLGAYLLGSLPFGLLLARYVAGVDVRKTGSGNIGATNVARTLGAKLGLAALALDVAKGLLPTLALPWLRFAPETAAFTQVRVACGIATVVGHVFPCWLGFRGGKGVATSLGVIVVIGPWATLAAFVAFAAVFAIWRIVSLGSVVAAVTFAAVELTLIVLDFYPRAKSSLTLFSLLVPALVLFRHRTNLVRLVRGEERALELSSSKAAGREAEGESEPPV